MRRYLVLFLVAFNTWAALAITFNSSLADCANSCVADTPSLPKCSEKTDTCLCYNHSLRVDIGDCIHNNCSAVDSQASFNKLLPFCHSDESNGVVASSSEKSVAITTAYVASSVDATVSTTGSENHTPSITTLITSVVRSATTKTSFFTPPSFTGQSILTGLCSQPYEVTATIGSKTHTIMFEGCGKLRPECCPNVKPGKPFPTSGWDFTDAPLTLAICPADYRQYGGICCPSNATPAREIWGKQTICVGRMDTHGLQTGVASSTAMQTSPSAPASTTSSGNPGSAGPAPDTYNINITYISNITYYSFAIGSNKKKRVSLGLIATIATTSLTVLGFIISWTLFKRQTGSWLFCICGGRRRDNGTTCCKDIRSQRTCSHCNPSDVGRDSTARSASGNGVYS